MAWFGYLGSVTVNQPHHPQITLFLFGLYYDAKGEAVKHMDITESCGSEVSAWRKAPLSTGPHVMLTSRKGEWFETPVWQSSCFLEIFNGIPWKFD